MTQDLPLLEWADELVVVDMGKDSISESKGCIAEMKRAIELGMTIKIINP